MPVFAQRNRLRREHKTNAIISPFIYPRSKGHFLLIWRAGDKVHLFPGHFTNLSMSSTSILIFPNLPKPWEFKSNTCREYLPLWWFPPPPDFLMFSTNFKCLIGPDLPSTKPCWFFFKTFLRLPGNFILMFSINFTKTHWSQLLVISYIPCYQLFLETCIFVSKLLIERSAIYYLISFKALSWMLLRLKYFSVVQFCLRFNILSSFSIYLLRLPS